MKTPDSLKTTDPREAISYGISLGIDCQILAKGFKMTPMAWDALVIYLNKKWNYKPVEELAGIIECFTVGYAVATGQVSETFKRSHTH